MVYKSEKIQQQYPKARDVIFKFLSKTQEY